MTTRVGLEACLQYSTPPSIQPLPLANFRQTIVSPLWDRGYTFFRLPDSARAFRFTVDACPTCQHLLNQTVYANAAGEWFAYDWCLQCDRGRLAGEGCPGLNSPCGKPATEALHSRTGNDLETARSVELHFCPDCIAEMRRIEQEAQADKEHAEYDQFQAIVSDADGLTTLDRLALTPEPIAAPVEVDPIPDWLLAPLEPVPALDAFFILPDARAGDARDVIIICIGGVSREISALEIARLLG